MHKFIAIVLVAWTVFFGGWVFVYKTGINTLAIQSEDTLPAIILPVTLLKEGTFYADTYYKAIIDRYPHPDDKKYLKELVPFYFRQVGGHYVSAFPIMAGLLSVPVYMVPVLMGADITWDNLLVWSHLSAALIMALGGGFFYLLAKRLTDEAKATLLTAIYLFATVNFALTAQALWQHGAVQLFTILSLLLLFKAAGKAGHLFVAGLFVGLAVLARPTAGVLVPYFVLLVLYLRHTALLAKPLAVHSVAVLARTTLTFLTGLVPVACFFVWYNTVYFGTLANQGYASQVGGNWLTPFPQGLLGLWFSPSKGLLVYSPVFIFALVGFGLTLSKAYGGGVKKNLLWFMFMAITVTHTLILGAWKHWYGGYSFGYRMAADSLPFLVLLLIPYLKSTVFAQTKKLFYAAVIVSVLIELMGLAFFDGVWHGTYDRGFWDQRWLWSIQNSELIFNISRLLLKLGA
jgi:hypothetical protein